MKPLDSLADLWSTTRFRARELSAYAETRMLDETRKGVMTLSGVFLGLLLASLAVHGQLGLGRSYVYTCLALATLSAHVCLSARRIQEIRALHVLGMTLLIISGTAFVLLAHQSGGFGAVLFTSVALLFMVVPLVPWGLREASIVTLLIYGVFSSSTRVVAERFDAETLWALQAFMLAAGVVSLTLVARGTSVRKGDLESRFALEQARREMERLSLQDPLTQTWNRRYLEAEYAGFLERVRKAGGTAYFAVIDVDRFKQLNDGLGHAFGDQVLQWLARAFHAHLGGAGFLARTGGDEFVLLIASEEPEALIEEAVSSLRARAAGEGPGRAPELSLSIGLAELPAETAPSLDDAYLVADGALYRAKRARDANPASVHLARAALGRRGAPPLEDG